MTYTKVDPILFSKVMALSIKSAVETSMFLLENDIGKNDIKFMGGLLLQGSESPFDLIALMDVSEMRRLSRSLFDMANHLIEVRIDLELAEAEKKKPRKKRKK